MKVGDLVRFYNTQRTGGCLPSVKDSRWTSLGLVQEVYNDGNVTVLWPERGFEKVAKYFLEVVNNK